MDRAKHRWPGFLDHEIAPLIRADRLPLLVEDVDLDPREGKRGRTGLRWNRPRQRGNHDSSRFRLPPGIDDRTVGAPDDFAVPHPCFRIDRFSDRPQQSERGEVVFERPLVPPFDKSPDGRRRSIKNVDPVPLYDLPKTVGFRPVRGAFIHQGCCAVRQWPVDNIGMSGDPPDVRGAPESIGVLEIENPLRGEVNPREVTSRRMDDPLRFACRSARVQNK